jgi:hypothetical protein
MRIVCPANDPHASPTTPPRSTTPLPTWGDKAWGDELLSLRAKWKREMKRPRIVRIPPSCPLPSTVGAFLDRLPRPGGTLARQCS